MGSPGELDRRTSRELMERLNRDAAYLAWRFRLQYRSIEAERANVKSRYGVCYSDGEIKIRLRHARTGRPLKYSSLVNTLCHELAHLRHFNHGERFRAFYRQILEHARSRGIYRPALRGTRSAVLQTQQIASVAARPPSPTRRTPTLGGPDTAADLAEPVQLALF